VRLVGPDGQQIGIVPLPEALATAREAVGAVTLGDALDRLHPWALSGATRTGLKERHGLLAEVRREVGTAAGTGEAATASR